MRKSMTTARTGIVMSGIAAALVIGVVAAPAASAMPRICDSYTARINQTWYTYTQTGHHADLMDYVLALTTAEDVGCL